MDRLHAYWRMPYLENSDNEPKDPHLFANLPKNPNDKDTLVLYRGIYTYLVMNKFPYNAGHLLAVPYREVADLECLEKDERADLMETILLGKKCLQKNLAPDGFNIGFNLGKSAGAGIANHLHGHVVPRWSGDNNFMPVLSQTRVLPEALENMWIKLYPFFNNCCQ